MMVGRSINSERMFRENVQVGEEVLRVERLRRSASAPEVSFSVRRGEIIGVAGLVGSGRTEAMRAIFGADPSCAGQCGRLSDERSKIGSSGDYEDNDRRHYREFGGNTAPATS